MAEFPALPLWTDAYLADTRHLTMEEHGAYMLLLMLAWRSPDCCLPDDGKRLARMLGITPKKWTALREALTGPSMFQAGNGVLRQKRLTRERDFVLRQSEVQRKNAEARWKRKPLENKDSNDAAASDRHMPNQCQTYAPTPTPTPTPTVGSGEGSAGANARDDPTLRERILAAIGVGPDGIIGPSAKVIGTAADMELAARWKADLGLDEREIIMIVAETMAAKTDGPPVSFKYFNQPMQRLSKAKTEPLPEALPLPATTSAQRSRNHGRSAFNAAIRATAEGLSAGTIHLDNSSRDPFARR